MEVVGDAGDARVRYVRAPEPLAMSQNWEHGLGHARGAYVVVLSDDDGLLPNTLADVAEVIRETDAQVVKWHRAQYNWPRYPFERLRNLLIYTEPRYRSRFVASTDLLAYAVRMVDCNDTPGLINCAVRADVLERLRSAAGRVLLSYSPDTASGIAIPCVAERILLHGRVLSIAGVSEFSNGTLTVRKDDSDIVREFVELNRRTGEYTMRFFETLGGSVSAVVLDSIHDVARHFPDRVPLPRIGWSRAYAQSVHEFRLISNTAVRRRLVRQIYRVARHEHGLSVALRVSMLVLRRRVADLVDAPGLRPVSSALRGMLNKRYGSRRYFRGQEHGFDDIASASTFLHRFLGRRTATATLGTEGDRRPLWR